MCDSKHCVMGYNRMLHTCKTGGCVAGSGRRTGSRVCRGCRGWCWCSSGRGTGCGRDRRVSFSRASIQFVCLVNVSHAKSLTLSNNIISTVVVGYDGLLLVDAEGPFLVVHNAVVVVSTAQTVHNMYFVFAEVVTVRSSDVVPVDGDVVIPVRATVFMSKSDHMTKFMECVSNKTTIVANGNLLGTSLSSNVGCTGAKGDQHTH